MSQGYDLTIRDAATLLRVSQQTVRRMVDLGHLACYRLPSGHRRFRQSDLDAFIADRQS